MNRGFTPSPEEVARARELIAAFAGQPGAGVLEIGGQMVDRPHLLQAERIIALAGDATG